MSRRNSYHASDSEFLNLLRDALGLDPIPGTSNAEPVPTPVATRPDLAAFVPDDPAAAWLAGNDPLATGNAARPRIGRHQRRARS